MTPEEFVQFVRAGFQKDAKSGAFMRLAVIAEKWTEAERRQYGKALAAYRKTLQFPQMLNFDPLYNLAVMAVGQKAALRGLGSYCHDCEREVVKILNDRRPAWLEDWIESLLEDENQRITWWVLNELVRLGACRRPTSDGYIRLFALMEGPGRERTQRSEVLRNQPELIPDLWWLFEVETTAFQFVDPLRPYADASAYEDWPGTLLALCDSGHLERSRLLSSCLRAIGGEFSANALTGFIRFHERLAPTLEEARAGQAGYLDLLSSPQTHVVKFALERLAALHAADALDQEAFLSSARYVFALKPKGHSQQVLSLAGKIGKQSSQLATEAANLASEALAHDSADVQSAAVKLLEGWADRLHPDHAVELREKLPSVAATIRPRLEKLIAQISPAAAETTSPAPSSDGLDLDHWKKRVAALDPRWRSISGADDALECAASDQIFGGIWFDVLAVPVLTSVAPIQPIATVDELLDAVARAFEHVESADELERILDGVSRLCNQRPADFELRAAPLLARLQKEQNPGGTGILTMLGMSTTLPRLLSRWLGGTGDLRNGFGEDWNLSARFVERRLRELEIRVAARRAAPLLSAPTHAHGWLDPRVLVQRLKTVAGEGREPPIADLVQGLLRLAPDHRSEAFVAAADLPGNTGTVVRFALGASENPLISDERSFALWLAAARARQAHFPLSDLAGAVDAAHRRWLVAPEFDWNANGQRLLLRGGGIPLDLFVRPSLQLLPAHELCPTLAIFEAQPELGGHYLAHWSRAWLSAIQPANSDVLLMEGVFALRERVEASASAMEPNYIYLQPLLQPDRPWNELTYLAVWLALVSKDAGSRGMAVDVLIAAIEDGRAQIKWDVLVKLAAANWFKFNRLADAVREIARVSPRHAWWWAELLQHVVAELKPWPSDIHHLHAALAELLAELDLAPADWLRDNLQSRQVGGKTGRLVKLLLAMTAAPGNPRRTAAHVQSLRACCERAERWSQESPNRLAEAVPRFL